MKKQVPYFLMRHAAYYSQEDQYISYRGMIGLKRFMEELQAEILEEFPNKTLRIVHSTLPRAKHTMLLMVEMLSGIQVLFREDANLNSDTFMLDQEYVDRVVSNFDKKDEVCLLLSHYPDIKGFCEKELSNSQYIRLEITREVEPPPEETDDLPF